MRRSEGHNAQVPEHRTKGARMSRKAPEQDTITKKATHGRSETSYARTAHPIDRSGIGR